MTIVDLLESNNLSWKCYVENLPPDADYKDKLQFDLSKLPAENLANVPPDNFPYARKHVPFLSFPSIVSNQKRLDRIVNADEFDKDLTAQPMSQLPHYSFYVPNLLNDGHNVTKDLYRPAVNNIDLGPNTPNLENMANFLQSFLGDDPVSKFPPETLIAKHKKILTNHKKSASNLPTQNHISLSNSSALHLTTSVVHRIP